MCTHYRFVILTYGRMPIITRRMRTSSLEDKFLHAFWRFLPERLSPLVPKPFEGFLPSICVCVFGGREDDCALSTISSVAETARVSSWTLSNCLPLIAFSHFPFNADFPPFVTLDQYSCLNPFIPGFVVARPNHRINVSSYHGLVSLMALHCSVSINLLFIHVANADWSWTESRIFNLYKPSRIFSLGISLADNKAWSHIVSKSCMSPPCKEALNRSDRSRAASWAPIARKWS